MLGDLMIVDDGYTSGLAEMRSGVSRICLAKLGGDETFTISNVIIGLFFAKDLKKHNCGLIVTW